MTGSGESLAARMQRLWPLCSGGRWERMSGGDEAERENYAGQRSQSGRKGSGGEEE